MTRTVSSSALTLRDPKFKAIDASALYAIAQAAINVELFTIPLYMGTPLFDPGHAQDRRQGRVLSSRGGCGRALPRSANPSTANEKAFNSIFSVFIQEMLHLQIAANMAGAIGVDPDFTSPVLQTPNHGWTCYGPDMTVIPHIVDLKDMDAPYNDGQGQHRGLDKEQMNLFLAIEENDEDARKHIVKGNYFPTVPFANWESWNTEKDPLPMFGTIGQIYQCYYDYLNLRYTDGTSLWQYVTRQFAAERPVQRADSAVIPIASIRASTPR